jgi:hypothetical protein
VSAIDLYIDQNPQESGFEMGKIEPISSVLLFFAGLFDTHWMKLVNLLLNLQELFGFQQVDMMPVSEKILSRIKIENNYGF